MAFCSGAAIPTDRQSLSSSISVSVSGLSGLVATNSQDDASSILFCSPTEAASLPTTSSSKPVPRPIKLRAACNHCFSAKVRCDGNKTGCRRCSEKRLECAYSESRVGKVVGKRRKRPLAQPVDYNVPFNSQSWSAAPNHDTTQAIPSPATTQGSDECTLAKESYCNRPVWATFVAQGGDHDQGFLSVDDNTDSPATIEMAGNRNMSLTSDAGSSFFPNSGLPTPALSPPQFTRYASPIHFQIQPTSRDISTLVHSQYSTMPVIQKPGRVPEDEETVCIKLLAHLKRHRRDETGLLAAQVELLKKSNAVVRRILKSKNVRSDYACQLLLSNVLDNLVRLCEQLCDQQSTLKVVPITSDDVSQFLHDEPDMGMESSMLNGGSIQQQPLTPPDGEVLPILAKDVLSLNSTVSDMLKKRPLDGFQMLGRHETFHIALEQRLMRVIAGL
ncbi:hypothetical protein HRR83_006238 [Exophiala dermatitidis]|nr:hypothetical protein HRR73_007096 [Exophiala dermatitidis]KAJ4509429.1 hypothetical protein HRR74_007210 [Exophiala dermatitidis]KAJ4530421.1 hypothetical protein HRR76_008138 [Exophiala dermatitidis]KAJ4545404.1 hypothetical protein HRR77_005247 [Exophiala dermatitidis]KAJ4570966.1 hypothetical protein HRR79_003889 [Exophiala dermatitidis]